jgi:hypothetical protein
MNFIVTIKNSPQASFIIPYLLCSTGYCIGHSYKNSKNFLIHYRTNKLAELDLPEYEKTKIKSEWDAVKYGAGYMFYDTFWCSIIWPISIASDIMPTIVLLINPPPPKPNDKI